MREERFTLAEWGKRLADMRAKSLTPKRRKEIAQNAANARWGKKKPRVARP